MVKIVTDSVSDLPNEVAKELDIAVIPLYVHFGSEEYKDGVDLSTEEFYHKLEAGSILPTTSTPPSGLFAEFFDSLAEETDEIMGIFVAKKLSATYSSALKGVEMMKRKCRVELIDSTLAIMAEGFLVIEAAKRALNGATLKELTDMISSTVSRIHVRITLDTLKYLEMGGRIGKAQALLGSLLKMNPIIGVQNGDVLPFGRVRSREKANEWLYNFASSFQKIEALAIEYGTSSVEAKALAGYLIDWFGVSQK